MTSDILIYRGKYGDQYWLVDTPARRDAAFRALFRQLDEWHCYEEEDAKHLEAARDGNMKAVRGILESRRSYEYEEWDIETAEIAE